MKFYITRHGETDWNNQNLIQGQIDNPLNQTGIDQAKAKINFFNQIKPDLIISSELIRAKETLNIIKTGQNWQVQQIVDNSFIERNFGELEGKSGDEYKKVTDFSTLVKYEQDQQIFNRVLTGLNKYTTGEYDNIVIASHSHAIRAALISLFPEQFNWKNSSLNNLAVVTLEHNNNEFKLISID